MRISEPGLDHEERDAVAPNALPSLACLWHLLNGQSLTLQQGGAQASSARPVLDVRLGLFLPDSICVLAADSPTLWNQQRAAVAHAVAHWKHSPRKQSGRGLKPMGHALVGALEDARVEWLLAQEFPGVSRWFAEEFPVLASDVRRTDFEGLLTRLHWALADADYEDDHYWIHKARTLFVTLRDRGELSTPEPLRRAASILANDLGQMRVRMNLQTFCVPAAYRDDNSFLWDLGDNTSDPPPELQSSTPPPPPQSAGAKPKPPDAEDGQQPQPVAPSEVIEPLPIPYPEWDYRRERLRNDWCTLYERLPPRLSPRLMPGSATRSEPQQAHTTWRAAMRTDHQMRWRRQWQGNELDLEAAIDWQLDVRAARDPSPRIFRDVGKASPPLSLLVLVDLSESCNDMVDSAGQSLLDLQKQALQLLATKLDCTATRLAMHGFHSDTRSAISYFRMLDFGERFDEGRAQLLRSLRAGYSTRLGAALRHATRLAAEERNAHRAIVVLTDGVPSDIDVFDQRYLMADARHAVHAARSQGVSVSALMVGEQGVATARAIYGRASFGVVRNAQELPLRLQGVLKRVI